MRWKEGGKPVLHMRWECQCVHIPVSAHSPCLQLRSLWKPFPRLWNVPEWKENSREGQKKSLMHITKTDPRNHRKKRRRSKEHTYSGIHIALFDKWLQLLSSPVGKDTLQIISGLLYTSVKMTTLCAKLNLKCRINNIE